MPVAAARWRFCTSTPNSSPPMPTRPRGIRKLLRTSAPAGRAEKTSRLCSKRFALCPRPIDTVKAATSGGKLPDRRSVQAGSGGRLGVQDDLGPAIDALVELVVTMHRLVEGQLVADDL